MATSRQLIINSQFKPFSYSEMLHPVMMADTAHKELEDSLGELQMKAGIWENLANEQKDERAYRMYKDYADTLKQEVGVLAASGLGPSSKQNLNNLRQQYISDIVPIETAYNVRTEQAKMQQAERNRDQTIRYNRDAADTSLDAYLDNPNLGYRAVSGNVLAGQVAVAADALQRDIIDNPTKYSSILGGQYIEAVQRKGFSAAEIDKAVRGDADANPILTQVVNNVMDSADIGDFSEQSAAELRRLASQGLYKAAGETKTQYLDPWKAKMDYQASLDRQRSEDAHKRALELSRARNEGSGAGGGNVIIPIPPSRSSGVRGEALPEVDRVIQDSTGAVTTATIQDLTSQRDRLQKVVEQKKARLNNLRSIQQEQKLPSWAIDKSSRSPSQQRAYEAQQRVYSSEAVSSRLGGRGPFIKEERELEKIDKQLKKELEFLNRAQTEYQHLSKDKGTALQMGLLLDKSQSMTQDDYVLTSYEDNKKVLDNMYGLLYAGTNDKDSQSGLYEILPNGELSNKRVPKKDARKILEDNITQTGIKSGYGKVVTSDEKTYAIKGEHRVDNANKTIKTLNSTASDFKDQASKNAIPVDYETEFIPMVQEGRILDLINDHGVDVGDGIKTIAFREKNSDDIIKLTMYKGDIIQSSLGDEIYNYGAQRATDMRRLSTVNDMSFQTIFGTMPKGGYPTSKEYTQFSSPE